VLSLRRAQKWAKTCKRVLVNKEVSHVIDILFARRLLCLTPIARILFFKILMLWILNFMTDVYQRALWKFHIVCYSKRVVIIFRREQIACDAKQVNFRLDRNRFVVVFISIVFLLDEIIWKIKTVSYVACDNADSRLSLYNFRQFNIYV